LGKKADVMLAGQEIIEIDVDRLRPHPVNEKIYVSDQAREKELLESIKDQGILEPLVVQRDSDSYVILSGTRRLRCAKALGMKKAPCIVTEVKNPILTIIDHNRYRQKTPIEIYNEVKMLEEQLKPIAAEHSKAQLKSFTQEGVVKFDDSEKIGDVRKVIAAKLNVSTGYISMLKQVIENKDKIPDAIEKLERGHETVYSAYSKLKGIDGPDKPTLWIAGYFSGKRKIARQIIARMPEHICYVEPFGGFCSVLLNKPPAKIEVYNDLNKDVTNFILCLKEYPVELISELLLMPQSRWLFDQFLPVLNEPFDMPDIKRAAIFFFLSQTSLAKMIELDVSFGFSKKRNIIFRSSLTGRLLYAANRLLNVLVENKPYEKILEMYDSEDTLFYVDPPYYETDAPFGITFSPEQHKELRDRLFSLKGKWLLTINDTKETRELYEGCKIEELVTQQGGGIDKDSKTKYYVNLLISKKEI
jgi:DNA adenine methylase